ncbi:MAG: tRNA 2-thiouridine(34) synthase MnmA [Acutalibacteraceae bacterium]
MPCKVMVAMSGGVDSSVTALLLKEQGFEVSGATMRLFSNEDIGLTASRTCCSLDDVEDARQVCDRLHIRHYVFNFSDAFRKQVIRRFADSYLRGETPNPCIDCNRYLKFRCFLERARLLEHDKMATGHYARIEYDSGSERWLLKKALDTTKDQTYVLYSMTQDELSSTLLPLGGLRKSDIRDMAQQHGFFNAHKPDSQDICFVPNGDYAAFLEQEMGVCCPAGPFVSEDGQVLGTHKGIHRYTIGQRKGLGIAAEKPLYVLKKDIQQNRVVLGDNDRLFARTLLAADCNWIAFEKLTAPIRVTAKARYRQPEAPAVVSPCEDGSVKVAFDTPQRALTAGQAVVFYDGDTVVGGGTILAAE